jgi:hypothetical protein
MTWFLLTVLGVLVNCFGLYVFLGACVHRTVEAGAATAGLGDLILAFILINAGILLMIEGAKRR